MGACIGIIMQSSAWVTQLNRMITNTDFS